MGDSGGELGWIKLKLSKEKGPRIKRVPKVWEDEMGIATNCKGFIEWCLWDQVVE